MQKTKKFKFVSAVVGAILCLPFALCLTACGGNGKPPVNTNSKEMYALSAMSSAMYLQQELPAISKSVRTFSAMQNETSRPESITEEDVNGAKNCITMFGDIIKNNGYTQTVEENTDTSEELGKYNFVMTISLPNVAGTSTYKLYYDEIATETNTEIEDEETETEISTTLEGVLIANEDHFKVEGKKVIETEGDETEYSLEFKTYIDEQNYVVVEQSSESNELEYEYEIYKNGVKVQNIEIEFEKQNNETGLEYELINLTSGVKDTTIYKIKSTDDTKFEISLIRNGTTQTFYAEIINDEINFIYDNNASQAV